MGTTSTSPNTGNEGRDIGHVGLLNLQHHNMHHPMMLVQQDYDSKNDHFHTQNIAIKDIMAKGNVDVSLQELNNADLTTVHWL